MKIQLISLHLLNFKGIRKLDIRFDDITNISADNAVGKTSIFDAFTWLLFGKDSQDAKDFNVKTLDAHNQPLHKLDHQVEGLLLIDNAEIKLRRTYREKWEKKRGEEATTFNGHETQYYYNDVPLQQKEFQAKITAMIDDNLAKLITSPTYFNRLNWADRRKILIEMAGGISDLDIAADNSDFIKLLQALSGKNLEEYKKEIAARKKKIKTDLDEIPNRIDEVDRGKPSAEDWEELSMKIDIKKDAIRAIDIQLNDKQTALNAEMETIRGLQQEKFKLEGKLREVQQDAKENRAKEIREAENKLNVLAGEIKDLRNRKENLETKISINKKQISGIDAMLATLRQAWNKINAEKLTIDPTSLCCPTCLREFEAEKAAEKRAEFEANFKKDKALRLQQNDIQGKGKAEQIVGFNKENAEYLLELETLEKDLLWKTGELEHGQLEVVRMKAAPEAEPAEIKLLNQQIAKLKIPESPKVDNTELNAQKEKLFSELDALNLRLATKQQITKADERITELKGQERELSQMLARLEKTEFTIAEFTKAKIEAVDKRINSKFKLVKFKMFEEQINGGERECCDCLVNGVPYPDVNHAGQIQAGLDIINALSEHYNVSAPIFIDNRESVSEIPETNSQVINLIVVRGLKELKIEGEERVSHTKNARENGKVKAELFAQ